MAAAARFGSPYAIPGRFPAIDVFDITQRNRSFNSIAVRDEI